MAVKWKAWHLEVMKMTLYMCFPVGCFHYFNSPQMYEQALIQHKQKTCFLVDEDTESLKSMLLQVHRSNQLKKLKDLQASTNVVLT